MRRLLIGTGLMCGLAACALAQDAVGRGGPARSGAVRADRLLKERIPQISFQDAPLEQVIDWLREYTGLNVNVRWQVLADAGIERDKPISLDVKNVQLQQVLWMIMNEAGGPDTLLAYRASGNLLILSTHEDLGKEMVRKVYDVSDLLVQPRRFTNGIQIQASQALQNAGQAPGQGGGGFGGGGAGGLVGGGQTQQQFEEEGQGGQDALQGEMQKLIDLITSTVEPDSWQVNGGEGTITAFRRQLVVRNSILVHQQLGGFLEE